MAVHGLGVLGNPMFMVELVYSRIFGQVLPEMVTIFGLLTVFVGFYILA